MVCDLTETSIPNTPEANLLFMLKMAMPHCKNPLRHLLQAAKTIIPRHCRSSISRTLEEWFAKRAPIYLF